MPPEDINVLKNELSNVVKWLEKIEVALTKQREETREEIKQIYERLDHQRDAVNRQECERYREKCCSRQEFRNEKQDDKITTLMLQLAKWGGIGVGIGLVLKYWPQ